MLDCETFNFLLAITNLQFPTRLCFQTRSAIALFTCCYFELYNLDLLPDV